MGRRTYASNEPFVIYLGDVGAEPLRELLSGQIEDFSVGGWRSATDDDNGPDYDGKLYPWQVTDGKGSFAYLVNSHPYADVGGEDWCLFGHTSEAVVAFAKALGVESPDAPTPHGIIQQTF